MLQVVADEPDVPADAHARKSTVARVLQDRFRRDVAEKLSDLRRGEQSLLERPRRGFTRIAAPVR
jgi:hypothetical protein